MPELNLGKVVGPQGPQGATGPTGPEGKQGPQGQTGEAGKSAYQAARDGGYTGTEADFNAILAIIERHAGRHKAGGADPLTAADVGAAPAFAGSIKADNLLDWAKTQTASVCAFVQPSNVPDGLPEKGAGYVFVNTSGASGWALIYYGATTNSVYYNVTNAGNWLGWVKLATTDYAVNKAGDTMTGNLAFSSSDPIIYVNKNGTGKRIRLYSGKSANFNAGASINLYNAEHETAAGVFSISARKSTTEGLSLDGKPDGSLTWGSQYVLHTGNKPSGSYTGTGAAWDEPLETGGIGKFIFIYSAGTMAIVSRGLTIVSRTDTGDISVLNTEEVLFDNGRITMNSNNIVLNQSGRQYYYQVP